ncbi:hypothetical protein [Natrialba sp. INN-245]|uniref:hypothetical protein n=1 Tax=Natrialba sp. INN-245 TaxID=2690967 RepID=UPI001356D4F3|nr:hypothetical protein [Natrialba sp. INN-245]
MPVAFGQINPISIDITETNAPIEGGDLLEVSASVTNEENSLGNFDIELFVEDIESTSETVTVSPEETEYIDFQHRVYPVTADVEFTVRVGGEGTSDRQEIEVLGVEELGEEYVNPDVDVIVQPETDVMFEVDDSIPDDYGNTHWFLDGEHEHQSSEPQYPRDEPPNGYEYWVNTFSDEGISEIAAAVDNEDHNYTYQWTISVDPDGVVPPTVEEVRPEIIGWDSEEEYDIELDIASPDDDLDRVVWWEEGASDIEEVSDISGSEDTSASVTQGGSAPTVWVITENNVVIEASPWEVEETPHPTEDDDVISEALTADEWATHLDQTANVDIISYEENTVIGGVEGYLQVASNWRGDVDVLRMEIDEVGEAYAHYVENGEDPPDWLTVDVYEQDGTFGGWYYIESEWAHQYNQGDITGEQYLQLVLATVDDHQ